MPSSLYTRDILRLAAAIPHLGKLDAPHARVERSSATCGSRVAVELRLDADGRVAAFAQEVKACALGQAAAALLGQSVIGRSATELAAARDALAAFLAGRNDDPAFAVFSAARPVTARHASILLAFDAAAAAAAQAHAPVAG